MSFTPQDERQRRHAVGARGESLVLEAGAGTGKTTLLVERIASLVVSGDALVTEIAAVTFTENAAATLKLRLRERLERARIDPATGPEGAARASAALLSLERAQVSTIHALCQQILQERPLDCGVAPGFRVADEAQAEALFAEAWEEWLAERLDASDPVLADAVRAQIPITGSRGVGEPTSLRGLARRLLWQRDLQPLVSDERVDPEAWREELLGRAARAQELRRSGVAGDLLFEDLRALEAFAESCRFLRGQALKDRLLALKPLRRDRGRRGNWSPAEAFGAAREIAQWTGEAVERWKQAVGSRLHADLVAAVGGVLTRYEQKKRDAGVLDFVDLLVKARDALRDRASVRRHARIRYPHLLIDEFQDTDPLQVEVADAIAQAEPGRLVVVGDAKQSIYRFRRADVALFRRLADQARERPGHAVLHLTQNFRSRPGILRFVNRAFTSLIAFSADDDQPGYESIAARPDLPEGAAVVALRFEAEALAEGAALLHQEARAIAKWIARAAAGELEVRDASSGVTRRSRAGDVMVLAPRLTQIRFLEEALDAAGLPFAVDGGKSFFGRQEVHEALATLRAIDDPSDQTSLVAALRSCLFGASDRDIVQYALAGGLPRIGGAIERSRPGGEALAPALELLQRLHAERLRVSPAALLERLYDETRVLAALAGTRRGEARAANLEKVAALARQATATGTLTLRGFTRLLAARMQDGTEEPDLPAARPEDPETVRILSIHKAKGLEAPLVVLHDLAANLIARADVIALWDERRVAIGFRAGCRPPGWNALAERDEARARAEGRRLLYVACTRARDRLVVPRPPADAQIGDFWRDLLPFLASAGPDEVETLDAATLPDPAGSRERVDPEALARAGGGDAFGARWLSEREELLRAGRYRPFLPISALKAAARVAPAAGVAVGSATGRSFGSLVHRILEWVPLDEAAPQQVLAMAAALGPGFGLDADAAQRAGEAALRTLSLPVMQRARSATRVFRELPLWFADGADLIEGVVDLVFEEDGALVVVDYKTDAVGEEQVLAQAAHHAPQLQLYGRGLAQATGTHVRERLVVFTALGRAIPV